MKQLLLLAVSLTVSSVMLGQTNPCIDYNASNINPLIKPFDTGFPFGVEVGYVDAACGRVSSGSQNATLTIRNVQGEGAVLTITIFAGTDAVSYDEQEILNSSNPSFTYNFLSTTSAYGLVVAFNADGSFESAITPLGVAPSDDDFVTVQVGAGVAPVTWTTPLAAKPFGESLELTYSVADQVDVAGYELERAVGDQPFAKVADIAYRENGSLEVDYSVTTPWVQEGSYYRIKQLDYAGTYDYSNVVFVEGNDGAKQRFQMFPNPANDFVRMSLPADVTSVDLISASGQLLRSTPAAEVRREGLDVRGVSAGLYLVRPVGGERANEPQRLVVNH